MEPTAIVVAVAAMVTTAITYLVNRAIRTGVDTGDGIMSPVFQDAYNFAVNELERVALVAVNSAEQTIVAELRKDGSISKDDAKKIKAVVINNITKSLGSNITGLLTEQLGDLGYGTLISDTIESVIQQQNREKEQDMEDGEKVKYRARKRKELDANRNASKGNPE